MRPSLTVEAVDVNAGRGWTPERGTNWTWPADFTGDLIRCPSSS
jgi:hypothetical protein